MREGTCCQAGHERCRRDDRQEDSDGQTLEVAAALSFERSSDIVMDVRSTRSHAVLSAASAA
jgi:hypothetical protein